MKKQLAECFIHLLLVATPSNVVMRTNDTDSLVIVIGCKQFYDTHLTEIVARSWNCRKIQSDVLVLVSHVKNLVHNYAMYQFFMPLQDLTIQHYLNGKGKLHVSSC